MNIFLTSYDQKNAASHLDDLRLNKMILETAQLLSSAYRYLFEDHSLLYKNTHINHPCAIWARKDAANYSWLVDYFDALAQEKLLRHTKEHKSWLCLSEVLGAKKRTYNLPVFDFNCTDFKSESDIRIAYQKQLVKKWQLDLKPPKWTGREVPYFFAS